MQRRTSGVTARPQRDARLGCWPCCPLAPIRPPAPGVARVLRVVPLDDWQNVTPPGGVEPPTFRLTAERANHCATEARAARRRTCVVVKRRQLSTRHDNEAAKQNKTASAGNRTRAARVAGEHSTTEPPMPLQAECVERHHYRARKRTVGRRRGRIRWGVRAIA